MHDMITLNGRELISRDTLRQKLGVHPMTISRWIKRGILPRPVNIGFRNYFDREEVEKKLFDLN